MLAANVEMMLAKYSMSFGRKSYLERAIQVLEIEIDAWKRCLVDEATSLGGQNMDGMPHGTTVGNPTERIAMMLMNGYEPGGLAAAEEELRQMKEELAEAELVVTFVDAWMSGLTAREKWLIEQLYFNGKTYSEVAREYTEKYGNQTSRESVRRMRKLTVEKICEMAK